MIDLHMHSIYSDGTWSPEQLVHHADDIDLKAMALTDHDTVDGLPAFMAIDSAVLKIPGVEISIDYDQGTFHMLGLFIDYQNKALADAMQTLQQYRRDRNKLLIEGISNLIGEPVTEADITENNKGELGRPHMAKFLIKKGAATDINDAFDRYLGKGQALYQPKKRFSVQKALKLIHGAGGISVLAHPNTLNLGIHELINMIRTLKEQGLSGIEAYYHHYTNEDVNYYKGLAQQFDLLTSAGSDFHGIPGHPNSIGVYNIKPKAPEELLEKMIQKKG